MDDSSVIREEAARLQLSGILGEARLRRLFDYLVANSLAGQSPKEIAIAIDVFGKSADFDVSQDALVRVYMHKLRRALEEFYGQPGNNGPQTLHIPKGEYRLRVSSKTAVVDPIETRIGRQWTVPGFAALGLTALSVTALAVMAGVALFTWRAPLTEVDQVRANPIWSALLKDDRPIRIVVGDYYLIGEADDSNGVKRLIREYTVNSKSDLDHFVAENPKMAERYMDVGLRYLPVSSAFALRDVMAVLAPQNRRITISKMSDVEPSSLKSDDIVYIGFLSGLGMLQDLVFTPESRFAVADSYDEVIDKKTKQSYITEVGTTIMDPPQPTGKELPYHDYGMFAKFRGPGGNLIVVISGTRDEGVSQTAETFTTMQRLQELGRLADVTHPVEALLEVSAFDGVNLSGKLVLQSNRDGMTIARAATPASPASAAAGKSAAAARPASSTITPR
jgi:hypothetical protein